MKPELMLLDCSIKLLYEIVRFLLLVSLSFLWAPIPAEFLLDEPPQSVHIHRSYPRRRVGVFLVTAVVIVDVREVSDVLKVRSIVLGGGGLVFIIGKSMNEIHPPNIFIL